jgi:molybdenum-dependent DNA-binding transcriptional regulator ModE
MHNPDQPDQAPPPLGPPANDSEKPGQDGDSGRISKKRLQCERLIQALFEHSSIKKAAASCDMSYVTAWRISKTQEFQEQYLAERRQSMMQSSARMQHASGAAVSTLIKLMVDTHSPREIQMRAAESILRHGNEGLQLEDVHLRVKRLEREKKIRERKLK